jgi:hypothetical protein
MRASIVIKFNEIGDKKVNEELIKKIGQKTFDKSAQIMLRNVCKSVEKFLKDHKINAKVDFVIDYLD